MPNIPLSKRALQTPPSPIRKLAGHARNAKAKGTTVYHLNIGQPDIPTPKEYFDGLAKYNDKVVAYESSEGNLQLRTAWSKYMQKTIGVTKPAEEFLITTGASEALIFLFMICSDPGDEIIIFDPTYANYIGFAAISGVNLVSIETKLKDNFALPSKEIIQSRITPRTRAILLCSPNNPTGTVYTKNEIQMLINICNERNIFLIADETYREFVYDGLTPLSVLHLDNNNSNIIVVDSLSKRFSLCGARLGCIITNNQEVLRCGLNLAQARLASPSMEQIAAAYMLDNISEDYLKAILQEYEIRRNTLYNSLSKIKGVTANKPQGAFYSVVQLPVKDSSDFAEFLLTKFSHNNKTVFVAPANGFYMTYQGGLNEVRMAYVLESQHIEQAAEILEYGLNAYQKI
jgi:aspartate aminotransferase